MFLSFALYPSNRNRAWFWKEDMSLGNSFTGAEWSSKLSRNGMFQREVHYSHKSGYKTLPLYCGNGTSWLLSANTDHLRPYWVVQATTSRYSEGMTTLILNRSYDATESWQIAVFSFNIKFYIFWYYWTHVRNMVNMSAWAGQHIWAVFHPFGFIF